jgi:mRNA-degrading endonuclease RelE of RelBE toxin-antitoxin system
VRKFKNPQASASIFDGVQALQDFPQCTGVKTLINHEHQYRLRVGNYRVFFNVDASGEVFIVSIEEVRKRNERTY